MRNAIKKILLNNNVNNQWLNDLEQHGCVSGMVNGLIYYSETTEFFNKHKEEINEFFSDGIILLTDIIDDWSEDQLCLGHVAKNKIVWFIFEYLAREVYDELS